MYSFIFTAFLAAALVQTSPVIQTSTTAPQKAQTSSTKSVPASDASGKKSGNTDVAPSDPVITIHGLCGTQAKAKGGAGAACSTVVTKQEFDTVVNALDAIGSPILPSQYHSVAEGYTTTVINYEKAKEAGVERDPRFAEVMRLARMRAMGDMYHERMQEQARKVSPSEIEAYYKNNRDKLEELTMRRLAIPRYNAANLKDEEFAARARKVAGEIHDRAAKGEDMEILQKEACAALGIKDPPTTKMGPVRRGIFAPEQEKQLFALKSGEVTNIIEQASTFIIFKLEGRETPTLEKAKDEIVRTLIKEHLDKQEEAAKNAVKIDFNDRYLGGAPASDWMQASKLKAENERHAGSNAKAVPPKSESPK